MPAPSARIGDINSYGAPIIATRAVNVITAGSPQAIVGSFVAPHDEKPVHIAVTTSISPTVLAQGTPVTTVGAPDTCFHVRVTGAPNVLM